MKRRMATVTRALGVRGKPRRGSWNFLIQRLRLNMSEAISKCEREQQKGKAVYSADKQNKILNCSNNIFHLHAILVQNVIQILLGTLP